MDFKIKHDEKRRRFFSIIDGKEALLTYMNKGDNVLIFDHTYVPSSLRGQGIAAKIVEEAFKYAKENNFKVIPTCSYVDTFVKRNKQYEDIVVD